MGIAELRRKLDVARNTFDYRVERVIFNIAEQVCKIIEGQGVSRSELAQRLAVSPAYVTKLLNGNPNLTIKTLLKISDALGQTLDIRFAPKLEIAQSVTTSFVSDPHVQAQTFSAFVAPLTVLERPCEANNDLALAA
ncbi:MAG: helix-turn-helix transcriptional regulator [Nitrospira sp.]